MKKKKITLLAVVLATAAMFTGCTIEDEYYGIHIYNKCRTPYP